MPFFQKLQDDLEAQIKLNAERQEIITALVFRHLIEHLPPNPYKNTTNATDRWLEFWKDAVIHEFGHPEEAAALASPQACLEDFPLCSRVVKALLFDNGG